jgi:hypothetical protein
MRRLDTRGEGAVTEGEWRMTGGEMPGPAEPWLGAWEEAFLRDYWRADRAHRAELRARLAALEREVILAEAARSRARAN